MRGTLAPDNSISEEITHGHIGKVMLKYASCNGSKSVKKSSILF